MTIECETPLLVSDLEELLGALDSAYEGVFAFEAQLTALSEALRSFRGLRFEPFAVFGTPLGSLPAGILVAARDRLIVQRVQLLSPGFVEVLGALNPLETIRKSLNDHAERRRARRREPAELEGLDLDNDLRREQIRSLRIENDLAEAEAFARIIEIARGNGVSEAELTALWNQYALAPLQRLQLAALTVDATIGGVEAATDEQDF